MVGVGLAVLTAVIFRTPWKTAEPGPEGATVARIGELLMTDYLLPFEAVSVLLLAALVGAAMLAQRGKGEAGKGER